MDEPIYQDLPDDPELAFLYLEEWYFDGVRKIEEERGANSASNQIYIEYMNKTLSARSELGIDILQNWSPPGLSAFTYATYLNFRNDVQRYRTAIQIRSGRRTKHFSVRLDAKTKLTIHHFISQIRELLVSVDLSERKKERLFDKLSAFENEVDRDRTRYESLGAAVIEFAGVIGDSAEALEPAKKWIDNIAKLVWGAKEEEEEKEVRRLPSPSAPKRIEPPREESPESRPEDDNRI